MIFLYRKFLFHIDSMLVLQASTSPPSRIMNRFASWVSGLPSHSVRRSLKNNVLQNTVFLLQNSNAKNSLQINLHIFTTWCFCPKFATALRPHRFQKKNAAALWPHSKEHLKIH